MLPLPGLLLLPQQDMDSSKLYWNKILDIAPADKTALEALKNIK